MTHLWLIYDSYNISHHFIDCQYHRWRHMIGTKHQQALHSKVVDYFNKVVSHIYYSLWRHRHVYDVTDLGSELGARAVIPFVPLIQAAPTQFLLPGTGHVTGQTQSVMYPPGFGQTKNDKNQWNIIRGGQHCSTSPVRCWIQSVSTSLEQGALCQFYLFFPSCDES